MLDPEKENLVIDAPLYNLIEEFTCGLCDHIVQPYPDECPQCHKLFCEACIKQRGYW